LKTGEIGERVGLGLGGLVVNSNNVELFTGDAVEELGSLYHDGVESGSHGQE